jgi:hypothetical protein
MNDITKIKEENKFYIPNFSLVFEEYLDIFTVFHTKERVYSFFRKLFKNTRKFVEENRQKDLPSPVQISETNPYVLGIDYGFFIRNMIDFIIENGGIVNDNEKKKVHNLIFLYFGVSFNNLKLNFAAQVLMKRLFAEIYGIANYRVMALKGSIFYPVFIENELGEYYKLNIFFIKRSALFKIFKDTNNAKSYLEFVEKNSRNFIRKVDNEEDVKELFKVEKNLASVYKL